LHKTDIKYTCFPPVYLCYVSLIHWLVKFPRKVEANFPVLHDLKEIWFSYVPTNTTHGTCSLLIGQRPTLNLDLCGTDPESVALVLFLMTSSLAPCSWVTCTLYPKCGMQSPP
jgi:hypothetical protein